MSCRDHGTLILGLLLCRLALVQGTDLDRCCLADDEDVPKQQSAGWKSQLGQCALTFGTAVFLHALSHAPAYALETCAAIMEDDGTLISLQVNSAPALRPDGAPAFYDGKQQFIHVPVPASQRIARLWAGCSEVLPYSSLLWATHFLLYLTLSTRSSNGSASRFDAKSPKLESDPPHTPSLSHALLVTVLSVPPLSIVERAKRVMQHRDAGPLPWVWDVGAWSRRDGGVLCVLQDSLGLAAEIAASQVLSLRLFETARQHPTPTVDGSQHAGQTTRGLRAATAASLLLGALSLASQSLFPHSLSLASSSSSGVRARGGRRAGRGEARVMRAGAKMMSGGGMMLGLLLWQGGASGAQWGAAHGSGARPQREGGGEDGEKDCERREEGAAREGGKVTLRCAECLEISEDETVIWDVPYDEDGGEEERVKVDLVEDTLSDYRRVVEQRKPRCQDPSSDHRSPQG